MTTSRLSRLGLLRLASLCAIVLLLAVGSAAVGQSLEAFDPAYLESAPGGASLSKVEQQLVESTNQYRSGHELGEVEADPKLNEAAAYFAAFMARTGKFGHEADGNQPSQRITLHGYDYCLAAENIAYLADPEGATAQELASRLMKGWQESKEHRENMLDPAVMEIGVAVGQNPESKKYYAVQLFGRPKSAAIRFQVVNSSDQPIEYSLSLGRPDEPRDTPFELPRRQGRVHFLCRPATLSVTRGSTTRTAAVKHGGKYLVKIANDRLEIEQQRLPEAATPRD